MLLLALLLALAEPPGLADAARAALAQAFPESAHRLEPRLLRTGGAIPTDRPLRVAWPTGDGPPRGHVQADVLVEGAARRAGWALFFVAHHDSVLVPRHALRRGEAVGPDALETVWIETTRLPGEPLRPADLRTLAGDGVPVAARLLPAGRPLRRGDLRPPPAADVGDAVTMRLARGAVVLELACRAREAGRVGEVVRLHCPDTGALYRARLVAPGQADWIETLTRS